MASTTTKMSTQLSRRPQKSASAPAAPAAGKKSKRSKSKGQWAAGKMISAANLHDTKGKFRHCKKMSRGLITAFVEARMNDIIASCREDPVNLTVTFDHVCHALRTCGTSYFSNCVLEGMRKKNEFKELYITAHSKGQKKKKTAESV